eukprot:483639_1
MTSLFTINDLMEYPLISQQYLCIIIVIIGITLIISPYFSNKEFHRNTDREQNEIMKINKLSSDIRVKRSDYLQAVTNRNINPPPFIFKPIDSSFRKLKKQRIIPKYGADSSKFAVLYHSIFSREECASWIDFSYNLETSYQRSLSPTYIPSDDLILDQKQANYEIIFVEDRNIALYLFERFKHILPKNMEIVGLNQRIRFLRYKEGQYLNRHQDTIYVKKIMNVRVEKCVSLVIYLNDGYQGGNTVFVNPFDSDNTLFHSNIIAQTGNVLLFDPSIWHKGATVGKGTKYVISLDAMNKCS